MSIERAGTPAAIVALALLQPVVGSAADSSDWEGCAQVKKLVECKDGVARTATHVDLSKLANDSPDLVGTPDGKSANGGYKLGRTFTAPDGLKNVSLNADDSVITFWLDGAKGSAAGMTLEQRDAKTMSTIGSSQFQNPVVALSRDGTLALLQRSGEQHVIVETASGKERAVVTRGASFGFSPDSRWVALSADVGDFNGVHVHATDTGALQLEVGESPRAAFSPSGKYIAVWRLGFPHEEDDATIRVYEIATRRLIREHGIPNMNVLALMFGHDERTVVAAVMAPRDTKSGWLFWDWPTGEESLLDESMWPVVVLTDDRFLQFKQDGIVVWDSKSREPVDSFVVTAPNELGIDETVGSAGNRILVSKARSNEWQVWERVR